MLFTCKQHCLNKIFFRGTYLRRISVFMQNFKFGGIMVLAVQLFNKIKKKKKKKKKKEKKMTKNMKKQVLLYFRGVVSKFFFFLVNLFFFVYFRH